MRFFKEKHLLSVFLRQVLLNDEVVDDEVLAFHRVLAHVVFQELGNLVVLVQGNLFEAHIRTDEMGEFIR